MALEAPILPRLPSRPVSCPATLPAPAHPKTLGPARQMVLRAGPARALALPVPSAPSAATCTGLRSRVTSPSEPSPGHTI